MIGDPRCTIHDPRSTRNRLGADGAVMCGHQSEDFRPAESPLQVQGTGNRAYRLQPPSMAMSSPISVRAHPPAPPGGTDGGPGQAAGVMQTWTESGC
eukprot:3883901-Rhodomonas_salina.1